MSRRVDICYTLDSAATIGDMLSALRATVPEAWMTDIMATGNLALLGEEEKTFELEDEDCVAADSPGVRRALEDGRLDAQSADQQIEFI